MKAWKKPGIFLLVAVFVVAGTRPAFAQQAQSGNYSVEQAYFGSGGEIEMTSPNYKSSAGVGDSASGSVEGVQYSGTTGSPTSTEPLLEFELEDIDDDHGILNPTETVYGSTSMAVRSYNGSGYIIQITGMPPTQNVHTIPGINQPGPDFSQIGKEQFGINLRNNTLPNIGTDPVQVPDETFSYGEPAPDYNEVDKYKFVSGDIIARSLSASGETHYTLSYILNLDELTPAGLYIASLSVVVSAKF